MFRWMPHAITVLGYFLSGVAGLQLGVLQGYASPLFPAAGWALAALLVFGPRVLPAVWIGRFSPTWWLRSAMARCGRLPPAP